MENTSALIVQACSNGLVHISLNRPKNLNVLTLEIVTELLALAEKLNADPSCRAILLDSTLDRAFCAGGDVKQVLASIKADQPDLADAFFMVEYQLDNFLRHLDKPLVVAGEGYVIGGGMGLMMAARHRVGFAGSRFSMPEVFIGLFPDVGASRFLADSGVAGLWHALTGSYASTGAAMAMGWINTLADSRHNLLRQLASLPRLDDASIAATLSSSSQQVNQTCGAPENLDLATGMQLTGDLLPDLELLKRTGLADHAAARDTDASRALAGCLLSMVLAHLLWQWGQAQPSWDRVYALENRLVQWMIRQPEFDQGVTTKLVTRSGQPDWTSLEQLSEESLQQLLARIPATADKDWNRILEQSRNCIRIP